MEERLGFVGVVVESKASVPAVNEILSAFGDVIRGRMGVPDPKREEAVICLIVRASNEKVGALTGRLGNLPGVQVKSALCAPKQTNGKKEF